MLTITQIAVTLENRPGALHRVCAALAQAGINITAIFVPEVKEKGKVRLVVEDLSRARDALRAARIRFSEEEALIFSAEHRPGALAEIAEKLAQAKVNIKYAYATTMPGQTQAAVILAVSNIEKALAAIGRS
ncbi:MAG: ACT domain-containing protein [Blastocatellia bacterium]|nr:ACT domain-containing protein [Blastocatellia bacterium]MCS7158342.1 ACT domain-containing protein [Blastocatellia bacterium]MCX7752848.1 ACT domain-containing protein [Blastocatellia bacterium]MDW8167904.1 ACT domain-containing protein [Acidobacteriota bacterium]MDW8255929.1 ACT domain-containing protein [Acidobacteriota bacterium]